MEQIGWLRRDVLGGLSATTGAAILAASGTSATAQQVTYSSGTEPAKLKVPANACDCHHHIYGSRYKVDPRSTLRPGDASVDDYRTLQKRIGTSRNVIVQPSTYGTENAPTLDALVAFGPSARAVVVVDTTVTEAELKRMHGLGARGIRFNLAQAGATTPDMIEPLAKRINDLGWHIQINAAPTTIMEVMPILEKVPSPIVFDHLAHIPEPDGINHPLFSKVRALIDKGKTWVKLSGAYADTKVGPPTYADSSAIARAYVKAAPKSRCSSARRVAVGPRGESLAQSTRRTCSASPRGKLRRQASSSSQYDLRLAKEAAAVDGRCGGARTALKQLHAELVLELGDLSAQGGLADVAMGSRRGRTAAGAGACRARPPAWAVPPRCDPDGRPLSAAALFSHQCSTQVVSGPAQASLSGQGLFKPGHKI